MDDQLRESIRRSTQTKATALSANCRQVAMKKYPAFISVVVLVTIASLNCVKTSNKGTDLSFTAGPELRWKYETGG